MTKRIKYISGILLLVILISASRTYSSLRDDVNDVNLIVSFSLSLVYILKIAAFFLLTAFIFYYPLFKLIRKRWSKIRSKEKYKNSQTAKAVHKFIMNGNALFGIITIFYALLLFVFGHVISPDPTPFADNQVNELSFKRPGFSITLLRVPLEREQKNTKFLEWIIKGKELNYKSIPINNYQIRNDTLYAQRYLGDGIEGEYIQYKLQDITGKDIPDAENEKLILHKYIAHKNFLLGTDDLGRDYLSRIIMGVRVSLSVGFVAVIIALFIGIPVGAFAGYYRKMPPKIKLKRKYIHLPVDNFLTWFMSVVWAIPTLLLVFPVVIAFGQQFYTIFIAVGLTMWVDIARLVRGQVMQVREMEFVEATKNFGYGDMRVLFKHILPNIWGPVIVITAANFAYAILTEAGLSFLGIGVQPPAPSWGLMISKYKDNLITDSYLPLLPGFAITLLVLAFFMIGNGLRDALDVKTKIEH